MLQGAASDSGHRAGSVQGEATHGEGAASSSSVAEWKPPPVKGPPPSRATTQTSRTAATQTETMVGTTEPTGFSVAECRFFEVTRWFKSIAQVWALVVSNDLGLSGLSRRLLDVPVVFVPFTTATQFGRARYNWGQLCVAVDEVDIDAPCEGKRQLEVRLGQETLRLGSLQGLFANAVRDIVQYIITGDPTAAAPFIVTVTLLMNHVFAKYGSTARILIQWQDRATVASVKIENRFGDARQKNTGEKRHLTEHQKATGVLQGRWRRLSKQGEDPE
jgi:hypothetical protein